MGAYERLLGDPMRGHATLFAREDTVEADWRIVGPIVVSAAPTRDYPGGTWGPVEADGLLEPLGGWAKRFEGTRS